VNLLSLRDIYLAVSILPQEAKALLELFFLLWNDERNWCNAYRLRKLDASGV